MLFNIILHICMCVVPYFLDLKTHIFPGMYCTRGRVKEFREE